MAGPLLVGVAGGTGSGKTTLARALSASLGPKVAGSVFHDAYYRHRPELTAAERDAINFDHPDSLETELMVDHLSALRAGHAVETPLYDFAAHLRRLETRRVEPTPVILVEGILVLADARVRALLDVKLFVNTEPDLRLLRRLKRDVEDRGRTVASVCEQYLRDVRPMHEEFVQPSANHADLIVPGGGENQVALALLHAGLGTSSFSKPRVS